MYDELAAWWPLLSPPHEYADEAAFYQRTLLAACERPPVTLLELGSGGGTNASYLKKRFSMVLVDKSRGMLDVSRALNPDCEHVEGDMRTVRLGRAFDCVFIHDAIGYLTTEADLRHTMTTAFLHCAPGGAALFAPDYTRETFVPDTEHGGSDAGDGRGLRYLEWVWDPDPADGTFLTEYVLVLRDTRGMVRVEHDRHLEGVFPRAVWLDAIADAGFIPSAVPFEHPDVPQDHKVFVGKRPL
jgi:hypothetical protein